MSEFAGFQKLYICMYNTYIKKTCKNRYVQLTAWGRGQSGQFSVPTHIRKPNNGKGDATIGQEEAVVFLQKCFQQSLVIEDLKNIRVYKVVI